MDRSDHTQIRDDDYVLFKPDADVLLACRRTCCRHIADLSERALVYAMLGLVSVDRIKPEYRVLL